MVDSLHEVDILKKTLRNDIRNLRVGLLLPFSISHIYTYEFSILYWWVGSQSGLWFNLSKKKLLIIFANYKTTDNLLNLTWRWRSEKIFFGCCGKALTS